MFAALVTSLATLSACGAEVRPSASTRSTLAIDAGLTRAVVDEAVASHVSAVRACYDKFAATEGRPMGVVRLGWTITPSGAATNVNVVSTSLHSASVEACVADEIARWKFPASARETEVTEHPFSF